MFVRVDVRGQWWWPGPWTRIIILVIVYVVAARLTPWEVLPLVVGGCLGGWATGAARPLQLGTGLLF
jgi:hypothetical protein